jgi:hypothetical protein
VGDDCGSGVGGVAVLCGAFENDATQRAEAIKDILLLLGIAAGAWLLFALPAAFVGGPGVDVTGPAWLACTLPGIGVLVVAGCTRRMDPMLRTGIVLGLGMVRLVLTLVVAGLTYYFLPHLRGQELGFVSWTTVCYLLLLAVETALVYRQEMSSQKTGQAL